MACEVLAEAERIILPPFPRDDYGLAQVEPAPADDVVPVSWR